MDIIPALTGSAWLDTLVALAAAAIVALCAHAVAVVLLRRILRSRPTATRFLRHLRVPSRWLVVLLGFQLVLQATSPELVHRAAAIHGLTLAIIGVSSWLAVCAVDALTEAIVALHPIDTADNLQARRVATQARVLGRTLQVLAIILGIAAALITFPGVRQFGATLLASAGVAGIIAGLAARPVLGNLFAGLQLGFTQPIRIGDVVIVENEWGVIEEIGAAFVVVKVWDERRLVVPLQHFIEKPFQNWTRSSAQIIGTLYLWVDYAMPIQPVREEFLRLCREAPEWDGRVASLQATEITDRAVQLRGIASSADAGRNWDLRCRLREGLLDFLQREYPQHLPRVRAAAEVREFAS
ncbi:MAG TPA: mechanosensitive ion channel domain-containing protein [Usitatibacter sp.]|nr:mechanosensitive ion channel domain-containing protein [Usitatibacter sp.]